MSDSESANADEKKDEKVVGSSNLACGRSAEKSPGTRKKSSTLNCHKKHGSCKDIWKKKKNLWSSRLNTRQKSSLSSDSAEVPAGGCSMCLCTTHKQTLDQPFPTDTIPDAASTDNVVTLNNIQSIFQTVSFPSGSNQWGLPTMEDCDEIARQERAKEIEEGIAPPPGFQSRPLQPNQLVSISELTKALSQQLSTVPYPNLERLTGASGFSQGFFNLWDMPLGEFLRPTTAHSQIDYIHCLVPDLLQITNCSFYWGKMDRYEAEKLLDKKPEGTFLLRDSAQEEFLFSVSFRRYGRTLHARVEQWNHKFSFDSHDPGVFASDTVCGLIEHYKDPSCCMFFEPMLTRPLNRRFVFSLQNLCRSAISSSINYDGVNVLNLPKKLKYYLKEYHYKQRIRVRRFDTEL